MKRIKNYLVNKKAEIDEVLRWALWILLILILTTGVYFLMKNIGGAI